MNSKNLKGCFQNLKGLSEILREVLKNWEINLGWGGCPQAYTCVCPLFARWSCALTSKGLELPLKIQVE